nr:hypothetical protein HK105_003634 [Polyrhizophydium stewartii]
MIVPDTPKLSGPASTSKPTRPVVGGLPPNDIVASLRETSSGSDVVRTHSSRRNGYRVKERAIRNIVEDEDKEDGSAVPIVPLPKRGSTRRRTRSNEPGTGTSETVDGHLAPHPPPLPKNGSPLAQKRSEHHADVHSDAHADASA